MFRILVADDEQLIRKGIIAILQRNISEPIEIIEAKSGIEALEKVDKESLNLIITDINMPGLNGLQFIKGIREKNVKAEVIVLSGYSNFEYAKEAISLGVKEYVAKPVNKEEFVVLINGYIDRIKAENQRRDVELELKQENKRIIEWVKTDFIVGLLTSNNVKESTHYLKQLKELKVQVEPQHCTCIVFQYESNHGNHDYIDFAVKNILDEYLESNMDNFLFSANYKAGRTVSIFKVDNVGFKDLRRKALIRDVTRIISKLVNVRVYAGIGDTACGFEYLHRVFKHTLEALEYKIFEPGDNICLYEEMSVGKVVELTSKLDYDDYIKVLSEFNRIFEQGNNKEVLGALKQLYTQVTTYVSKRVPQSEQDIRMEFSQFWTLGELKREVKGQLQRLQSEKADGVINVKLMEEIIDFIDENVTDELDLNLIADKFNRSSSYISTMFKRYVSGGFNAYVTDKRMAIAKELLKENSVSIQSVAEASGYYNAKYFSSVFKKREGITPREYREQKT